MPYIVEVMIAPCDVAKFENYRRSRRSPRLPSRWWYLEKPELSGVAAKVENLRMTPTRRTARKFETVREIVETLASAPPLISFDKAVRRVRVLPA